MDKKISFTCDKCKAPCHLIVELEEKSDPQNIFPDLCPLSIFEPKWFPIEEGFKYELEKHDEKDEGFNGR